MDVQTVAVAVAAVSAVFGVYTYRKNSRIKAHEFLSSLHKSFFVDGTYKNVRDILDDDPDKVAARVATLVVEEPAEFTDFLNFFELVAYMGECGTLSRGDVEALLGYYLQILTVQPGLQAYICNENKGFEHLDRLLKKRSKHR